MRLDEIAGNIDTNTESARAFISSWFEPEDLVVVVGTREKRPDEPHLIAQWVPAGELVEQLDADPHFLENMVLTDDGSKWNVYVQVNPAVADLEDMYKRGGDDNVKTFRGVWVDLDVKPSSFATQDDALNYLRGLKVWPTMVVLTGSGGVHAYWRLRDDLTPGDGRDLARAWWSYLSEQASAVGAQVDKLVDIARMMRLPGTVRWPKTGEASAPHQVSLLYSSDKAVTVDELMAAAKPAAERRVARIRETVNNDGQRRWDRKTIERALTGSGDWQKLQLLSRIDDEFNSLISWDDVLGPLGWTYIRTDRSERREWARPGREDKSATTDWPDSPDVMSLLSSSEDTGLFDLKEAEIPLTKYRVALRLLWNDDETAMVEWVLNRLLEESQND